MLNNKLIQKLNEYRNETNLKIPYSLEELGGNRKRKLLETNNLNYQKFLFVITGKGANLCNFDKKYISYYKCKRCENINGKKKKKKKIFKFIFKIFMFLVLIKFQQIMRIYIIVF